MSSSDFMKVMIAQLQHQDPMNPSSSSDLLTQMSQISQLQSNQDLSTNLKGLSLQQSIGAGGNLIGKTVSGLDDGGNQVNGVVTSVKVQDKNVYLELDSGKNLQLTSITQVAIANAQTPTVQQLLASSPSAQSLLQSIGGGDATSQGQLAQLASTTQGQALLQALAQAQSSGTTGSTASSPISGLLQMFGLK